MGMTKRREVTSVKYETSGRYMDGFSSIHARHVGRTNCEHNVATVSSTSLCLFHLLRLPLRLRRNPPPLRIRPPSPLNVTAAPEIVVVVEEF